MTDGRVLDDGAAWESSYRVRFEEAGPDGHLRTSGFLRYAQDVGWQHSTALGFDRAWYAERGINWLVRTVELEVLAPIPMGATIRARTEVVGQRRVWARRRGEFRLEDGSLAAWTHTDWVLIDDRGVITRIPPIFGEVFRIGELTGQIRRVDLPAVPPEAIVGRFTVRPHELDPMAHVNNAVYLDWLEEGVLAASPATAPAALARAPRHYALEYAQVVDGGATVEAATWPVDGGWCFRLAGPDGGPDHFRGRVGPGGTASER